MGNLFRKAPEEPKELFTINLRPSRNRHNSQEFKFTMQVHSRMTVEELRQQFSAQYLHDERIRPQFAIQRNRHLSGEKLLQDYGIKEGSEIEYFEIFIRGGGGGCCLACDIGVFDENHHGSMGSEVLKQEVDVCDVKGVVEGLKGNQNAKYELYEPGLITEQSIIKIKEYADKRYESDRDEDLKIILQRDELIELTSEKEVNALETLFSCQYNQIVIRRCQAHGKFINFHTDHSKRTLQVALNDDFQGGKLVYLTGGQMHTPARKTGSITIHENDIVHGVNLLNNGKRYGLFLLQT